MQQGKTITFASLFSEVSNVVIPIIQRDYAQGREEAWEIRDQFLHSISQALTAPVDALPLDLDFIYGNLSTEERPTLSVLDGQQRLTTLFLLHWYLANKESKYADFSEQFAYQGKSRFTYQTRTAATEFFHALVRADSSGLKFAENAPTLREQITDSSWFYHSWLQDPTVSASLTMLNAIQSCFGKVPSELYAKLCSSDSQPVVFQYLNLSSFGLSDDLYIKMNSRGKSLTDFENFKAWLSGRMSQQHGAVTFGEKIDQAWTDMFWNLSKERTESFDTLFLRFFKRMAFLLECSQSSEPAYILANLNAAWFNALRSIREGFSSSEFEARDTFNPRNIQLLSTILDFLCSPHATLEHRSLLMEFLTGSDLLGACRFYALCAFITAKRSSIDARFAEQHAQWSRVTDNFLYTMRIDSNQVAVGIVRSLDELAPYADDIYSCLRTVEVRLGFNEQWDEEALKAKLIILDSAWEPALIRAESHPHLKGRIRGLLKGAKTADNSGYDLTRFIALTEKTYWVLNEKVLHNYEHLLERALLSLGDYLIWQKGQRYTFCLPSHQSWRERNENWLRVTEKSVFIELLDKLNKKEDMSNTLREIIQESNPGGWRELVVKDPETIRYCSERIIDKLDNQVYLLSKTNLRGYFRELHSWVLSKKLLALLRREDGNVPFTAVTYHSVYGDAWPCIELTVSEDETFFIAHENGVWFDCNNVDEEGESLPLPPFFKPLVDKLMHEADTVSGT
ncbi:DUF262 domain-containing protein [Klebsiella oxytoca]|uniref:DUF262 domain-containing protein n=1 Tax=Klebsiella TaxID=570 RepID=UPI0018C6AE5C|nr:DUF262 domain-containing protein [Klebsiella oxytoca]MBG2705033.1 DUF262 domain-containing protein [Klebsiella oxytoca]HEJ7344392.1 DUF262 domain-containing protein [Klebsiella oxytoca]